MTNEHYLEVAKECGFVQHGQYQISRPTTREKGLSDDWIY